jgi:hypothetical protein
MSQSEGRKLKEQIESGKIFVENSGNQGATSFRNEHQGKVNRDGLESVKKQASDAGLNRERMESKVVVTGSELKNKHKDITAENNVQYKAVKHANEFLESGLNKRVDKHEEDRIGRGKIAKTAAKALGSIPFTDLGSNIGGECSSNCVKKRLSLQTKLYQERKYLAAK